MYNQIKGFNNKALVVIKATESDIVLTLNGIKIIDYDEDDLPF